MTVGLGYIYSNELIECVDMFTRACSITPVSTDDYTITIPASEMNRNTTHQESVYTCIIHFATPICTDMIQLILRLTSIVHTYMVKFKDLDFYLYKLN